MRRCGGEGAPKLARTGHLHPVVWGAEITILTPSALATPSLDVKVLGSGRPLLRSERCGWLRGAKRVERLVGVTRFQRDSANRGVTVRIDRMIRRWIPSSMLRRKQL